MQIPRSGRKVELAIVVYAGFFLVSNFAGVSFFSDIGWAPYTISNTNAPSGSMWVEGSSVRWTDGSTEYYFPSGNLNTIDTSSPGPNGAAWIEGGSLHWVDGNGDEQSFTGLDTSLNPSGGSSGNLWMENRDISSSGIYGPHIIFRGTRTDYYTSANPPGQSWDDAPFTTGTGTYAPYSNEWTFTDGSEDDDEQHHFSAGGDTTTWNSGEYLIVWVQPDSGQKANKFMVQIHTTADGWDNRAQWGGSSCKYGSDGSTCNIISSNTPTAGEWSALVIGCGDTGSGSCGETVDGLAFTTDNGDYDTFWDSGIFSTDPREMSMRYIDSSGNERAIK